MIIIEVRGARQDLYGVLRYSAVQHIPIDEYVVDVLLPDLTGHDHSPTAFLVYIVLWTALYRAEQKRIALSLQNLSEGTGLSKSGVQSAIRLLKRRGLIKVFRDHPTAVPEYELVRHWVLGELDRAFSKRRRHPPISFPSRT